MNPARLLVLLVSLPLILGGCGEKNKLVKGDKLSLAIGNGPVIKDYTFISETENILTVKKQNGSTLDIPKARLLFYEKIPAPSPEELRDERDKRERAEWIQKEKKEYAEEKAFLNKLKAEGRIEETILDKELAIVEKDGNEFEVYNDEYDQFNWWTEEQGQRLLKKYGPYTGKAYQVEISDDYDDHISHVSNYKNGKAHGLHITYHRNSIKAEELLYEDGLIVEGSKKYWNNKGQPVSSAVEAYSHVFESKGE